MAEKLVRHLLLLRTGRWMKTERDAELFDFRPKRIEAAVVNPPAVDRLGTKRETGDSESVGHAAHFIDGEGDVMQRDERGSFKPLRIFLAEIDDPIVPSLAEIIGILRLQCFIAVQRRATEEHGDVQT